MFNAALWFTITFSYITKSLDGKFLAWVSVMFSKKLWFVANYVWELVMALKKCYTYLIGKP